MGEIPENMYSLRHVPWHKDLRADANLVISDEEWTSKRVMVEAGLDIAVTKSPVWVQRTAVVNSDTGLGLELSDEYVAVTRDDDGTIFQIAKDGIELVQNWEMFKAFDHLQGIGAIQTAFDLKHGAIICISALLEREIMVGGVDKMLPYFCGLNSHNSSLARQWIVTPLRPLCENTMNLAMERAIASIKMKHTSGNVADDVKDAERMLAMVGAYYDEFEAEANRMINTELTKTEFEKIIRVAFPKGKVLGGAGGFTQQQYTLIGAFESTPTLPQEYRYTQWGAANAVGEYFDWARRAESKDEDTAADNRALSTLTGDASKNRQRFYDAMVAS